VVGESVGVPVGLAVVSVGGNVGEFVGSVVGESVGVPVGLAVISSPSPQKQVQMSGNSLLTNIQAPASSKGPLVIPALTSVASSASRIQEMRPPQLYPSARVFQISSVHFSHPHRTGEVFESEPVGGDVDNSVGGDFCRELGDSVGEGSEISIKLSSSVLNTVLLPYVL